MDLGRLAERSLIVIQMDDAPRRAGVQSSRTNGRGDRSIATILRSKEHLMPAGHVRRTPTLTAVLASLAFAALASTSALALEPLKLYDKFSSSPINGNLWLDGEHSSQIKGGVLVMSERMYSPHDSNTGENYQTFRTAMAEPLDVNEMKATITVTALEVNTCAANSFIGSSRARVQGSFFNSGTPTPGSSTNDVLGQGVVARFANSTDPAGVYQVYGQIVLCTNDTCSTSTSVARTALGTVNIGTSVVLEVQWDQANHQFLFARDNGAAVAVPYTLADTNAPGSPVKDVDVRVDVANCVLTPALTGYVQASFDNVYVNKSAAP
jgi:hypothetical protein